MPSQAGPSRVEPSRADPSRAEPSRAELIRAGQSRVELAGPSAILLRWMELSGPAASAAVHSIEQSPAACLAELTAPRGGSGAETNQTTAAAASRRLVGGGGQLAGDGLQVVEEI